VITAAAERFRAEPGPWALFRDGRSEGTGAIASSLVQFPVLVAEARRQGRWPQVERGDGFLRITV
jgi:hypothetical protein